MSVTDPFATVPTAIAGTMHVVSTTFTGLLMVQFLTAESADHYHIDFQFETLRNTACTHSF